LIVNGDSYYHTITVTNLAYWQAVGLFYVLQWKWR